ncbi:hypothetical protein AKO1_003306 [Acrasis kona]|uniref:Uncharacterized protein n=1 Tax=Acrasis kona TaxID=1008807 RepID=A0AAW2Z7A8_9EUKA
MGIQRGLYKWWRGDSIPQTVDEEYDAIESEFNVCRLFRRDKLNQTDHEKDYRKYCSRLYQVGNNYEIIYQGIENEFKSIALAQISELAQEMDSVCAKLFQANVTRGVLQPVKEFLTQCEPMVERHKTRNKLKSNFDYYREKVRIYSKEGSTVTPEKLQQAETKRLSFEGLYKDVNLSNKNMMRKLMDRRQDLFDPMVQQLVHNLVDYSKRLSPLLTKMVTIAEVCPKENLSPSAIKPITYSHTPSVQANQSVEEPKPRVVQSRDIDPFATSPHAEDEIHLQRRQSQPVQRQTPTASSYGQPDQRRQSQPKPSPVADLFGDDDPFFSDLTSSVATPVMPSSNPALAHFDQPMLSPTNRTQQNFVTPMTTHNQSTFTNQFDQLSLQPQQPYQTSQPTFSNQLQPQQPYQQPPQQNVDMSFDNLLDNFVAQPSTNNGNNNINKQNNQFNDDSFF